MVLLQFTKLLMSSNPIYAILYCPGTAKTRCALPCTPMLPSKIVKFIIYVIYVQTAYHKDIYLVYNLGLTSGRKSDHLLENPAAADTL